MSKPSNKTTTWELIGLIAALVIVVSLPVYYFSVVKNTEKPVVSNPEASFCRQC